MGKEVKVQTAQLIRLAHAGLRHQRDAEKDAGVSMLSLVALNLRKEQVVVDARMYPYYLTLRNLTTRG
jgi:hypothetical protein